MPSMPGIVQQYMPAQRTAAPAGAPGMTPPTQQVPPMQMPPQQPPPNYLPGPTGQLPPTGQVPPLPPAGYAGGAAPPPMVPPRPAPVLPQQAQATLPTQARPVANPLGMTSNVRPAMPTQSQRPAAPMQRPPENDQAAESAAPVNPLTARNSRGYQ